MSSPFNVLVSSAGRRVALIRAIGTSLGRLGLVGNIHAADISQMSPAMESVDRKHLVPRCTSDEFIPRMLEICEREGIRLVIPTIDTELRAYAESRDLFAASGVTVAVSSAETIEIGADKTRTHQWLMEHELPTVRQSKAAELLDDVSDWRFPCIAKPNRGSASLGVARVSSLDELRRVVGDQDYVAQEIAPGHEHTLDVLVTRAGGAVCVVPRKRLEVRAGEVSKGVTVRNRTLENLGLAICDRLPGAYGVITVQVFLDEASGEMNVIEMNARFGGGFPLSYEAGADYPRWMIEDILNLPVTASREGWRNNLVMLRYDDAVYRDGSQVGLQCRL